MEKLLEKAFEEASKLDVKEQKSFAAFIFKELEMRKKWHSSFQKTESELSSLAKEALSDYKAGNTDPLDADEL